MQQRYADHIRKYKKPKGQNGAIHQKKKGQNRDKVFKDLLFGK